MDSLPPSTDSPNRYAPIVVGLAEEVARGARSSPHRPSRAAERRARETGLPGLVARRHAEDRLPSPFDRVEIEAAVARGLGLLGARGLGLAHAAVVRDDLRAVGGLLNDAARALCASPARRQVRPVHDQAPRPSRGAARRVCRARPRERRATSSRGTRSPARAGPSDDGSDPEPGDARLHVEARR